MNPEELAERLSALLQRAHDASSVRIDGLRLLTGGASRQTWSFDAVIEDASGETETLPLVLRRDPRPGTGSMGREIEFKLLKAARDEGVPAPAVHLMGDDTLGAPSFMMERIEGETIARRILRDEQYAEARETMAAQLGAILASIHRVPIDKHGLDVLPAPPPGRSPAAGEVDKFEAVYRAITPEPHPAFELAFRWLRAHLPPADGQRGLVHGDYRLGNIIVGPEGVRAVLDWELSHIGDPMEDLGWVCVRSWRFGNDNLPVAGVGTREQFWRAYEAAGGTPVDAERVRFWETFGNLRWGVICIGQAKAYLDNPGKGAAGPQLELGSIGRRIAETEWELLELMEGTA
ncbi:MAG: phosphotransferase family protein [Dehalococcoidia bacterium]